MVFLGWGFFFAPSCQILILTKQLIAYGLHSNFCAKLHYSLANFSESSIFKNISFSALE